MSQFEYYADGFDDFSKMLEEFSKKTEEENILKVLEYGAEEYAKDLRALPKPRSKIMTGGYTHLIDTISTRRNKKEIEVGWGKYYGPMVDRGTNKMGAQAHIRPTFEKNSKKYYETMSKKILG